MNPLIRSCKMALGLALAAGSLSAAAALHDRGGGLLYDDVLDVTWLQDANYAKTTGYDSDGMMSWSVATAWVDGLSYHDAVRDVTYTDWRLPTVAPIGASFHHEWQWDGSTDEGYNIRSPNSELSYMYYVNLGLNGWYLTDGTHPRSFGVMGSYTAIWTGQADIGLAKNVQSNAYWSMTEGSTYADRSAWTFTTAEGVQRDGFPRPDRLFVWAVRDGDVLSPVPETGTMAMSVAGLLALFGFRAASHRRRSH